jgi:hypothetical protein
MTAALPAMMKQPRLWQVAIVFSDRAESGAADGLDFGVQPFDLGWLQFARGPAGMNFGLPENFVRHPVADARKAALHEEDGLDRRAAMTRQKLLQRRAGELPGEDLGGTVEPPRRLSFPAMKQDPAELARVAQDQAVPALPQNQMIVFERDRRGSLDPQLSRHAQMNAQPAALGKAEEQLFAVGLGTQQSRAAQRLPEGRNIRPAKDFLFVVQLHGKNLLPQTPPPLLAEKLDFGQFRHEAA